MTDLPIYSPSETEDYLTCPRYRLLKKQWQPRGSVWTPHRALGNAIHAGLAEYHGGMDHPLTKTLEVLEAEFVAGSEWTLEGLSKLVEKGLKTALGTELVSEQGVVVAVEQWAGHCRIDLVSREPIGLIITDHKVKLELEKRKLEYTVRDFDPSWQLLHEAWAWRAARGETPRWSRAHLVVLGPRPFTYIHSIEIDDARLDDFERSGYVHWARMLDDADRASGYELPPMNTRSCWRYGRKCEFYDGCHVFMGDVSKFPTLYEPREER